MFDRKEKPYVNSQEEFVGLKVQEKTEISGSSYHNQWLDLLCNELLKQGSKFQSTQINLIVFDIIVNFCL